MLWFNLLVFYCFGLVDCCVWCCDLDFFLRVIIGLVY